MLHVDTYRRRSGGRGRAPRVVLCEREDGAAELMDRGAEPGGRLRPVDGDAGGKGSDGGGLPGNGHGRRQADALISASHCNSKSQFKLNKLASKLRHSSKQSGETPIKMLIDQEMSKDMKLRKHSPGVVAKLMGLDTLPAQLPDYMQHSVPCLQKQSPKVLPEKHLLCDSKEYVKDVFDVAEEGSMEPGNSPIHKGLSKSRHRHKKTNHPRQKLMDVKRLSTLENFKSSKQFLAAFEVLESNKDLFLKLLREPSSLCMKPLEEYGPTPTTKESSNHIMILKSRRVTSYENNDRQWRSWTKKERNNHIAKNVMEKYHDNLLSRCIREHDSSIFNLPRDRLDEKKESCSLPVPTHIVVLKPSLENAQDFECQEDMRNIDFRRSGKEKVCSELRHKQVLSNNDTVITQRTVGSRQILEHRTNMAPGGHVKSGSLGRSVCSKSIHSRGTMPTMFMDFKTLRRPSSHRHASSYSAETTVSREARKHLSERCQMINNFHRVKAADEGASTLGEMLALCDKEMLEMQRSAEDKMSEKKMLARQGSPLGISSHDAWKGERIFSLHGSGSFQASSLDYGSKSGINSTDNSHMVMNITNPCSRKPSVRTTLDKRFRSSFRSIEISSNGSQHSNHVEGKNCHQVSEYNLEDGCQSSHDVKKLYENKAMLSELKDYDHYNEGHLINWTPAYIDDADWHCPTDKEKLPHTKVPNVPTDINSSAICRQKEVAKAPSKEPTTESIQCAMEQTSSPAVGHPSSASVLEAPDEHDSNLECFKRVKEDLQELQMKIQLLKSGKRGVKAESLVTLSGEDADQGIGGNHVVLNDEENMESRYLSDILTQSGFRNANWDMLYYACYLPVFPIGSEVFEKLEEMYSQLAWSRTERRLLFDLLNSTLQGILALSFGKHPWTKVRRVRSMGCHKHLIDEVSEKSLLKVRKDAPDDPVAADMENNTQWPYLGDDLDLLGWKLERALTNILLEELSYDLLCTG